MMIDTMYFTHQEPSRGGGRLRGRGGRREPPGKNMFLLHPRLCTAPYGGIQGVFFFWGGGNNRSGVLYNFTIHKFFIDNSGASENEGLLPVNRERKT